MQHALRVDTIDPTKGFVHDILDTPDILPTAANMGLRECRMEKAQLSIEISRAQTALAIAKRCRDKEDIAFIGHKLAAISARFTPINIRLSELQQEDNSRIVGEVVKEMLQPEMRDAVFREVAARMKALGW